MSYRQGKLSLTARVLRLGNNKWKVVRAVWCLGEWEEYGSVRNVFQGIYQVDSRWIAFDRKNRMRVEIIRRLCAQ